MDGVNLEFVSERLRAAGARFAFLHGSRGDGVARPDSDVDIAAWFGRRDVDASAVAAELPGAVDLLVLDTAPLELAGRVAQAGRLLFEVDPEARVNWQATTRRVYLDEKPRIERRGLTSPGRTAVVDPERLHRLLRRVTADLHTLRGYAALVGSAVLADPARLTFSSTVTDRSTTSASWATWTSWGTWRSTWRPSPHSSPELSSQVGGCPVSAPECCRRR